MFRNSQAIRSIKAKVRIITPPKAKSQAQRDAEAKIAADNTLTGFQKQKLYKELW
mgnify:FL=1